MGSVLEEYREWKKKHPDFPLTVNPNGQWSKKVRGRVFYFGALSDPDSALDLWLQDKDYLLAGQEPPTYEDGLIVKELCKSHKENVDSRIASGKLSPASLRDYRFARKFLKATSLYLTPICRLTPEHFTEAAQKLGESSYSLRTQKNIILSVKTIFNWGRKMELYEGNINYGPDFTPPSLADIEAEQEDSGRIRFFDRELIIAALAAADARMKVVILLGINCAFYAGDTEAISYKHLHLDAPIPFHNFRRVKTRRRRMAALWPETVAAIKEYTDLHRPKSDSDEIILSQYGTPYTRESSGKSLSRMFDTLIEEVGERPFGASLGSLRHTYGTIMDFVTDTQMVDLTMGHTSGTIRGQAHKSLQRRIYSQMNLKELERLKAVADVVHDWLYKGKIS